MYCLKSYVNLFHCYQIPVGKMYHCPKRGRGIHVKSSDLKNVLLRDDWSYQRVLDKCIQEVYGTESQNAEFYIADKGGVPIWTKDVIELDLGNGGVEEISWSLHQYILLSKTKYPSKTKLYCVKKGMVGSHSNLICKFSLIQTPKL